MKIAKINNTHIHYSDSGPQNGPVIVFSNSLGSDYRIWDRLAAYLEKKYRVIRYDKRGHGLSDVSDIPCSIKLLADDLAALLDYLKIEKSIICGISVGGMIAQQLAVSNPDLVQGLVLCNTSPKIGTEESWQDRINTIETDGITAMADAIVDRWFSAKFRAEKKAEVQGWKNMLTRTTKEGYLATCEAIRAANLTGSSEKINVPVLCIAGSEDLATPVKDVQDMAMMINDATFKRIDDAAHLPPIEKPELLAFHINEFTKENDLV